MSMVLRWALLPVALIGAFSGAVFVGTAPAAVWGLEVLPVTGAFAAATVVVVGWLHAPTHKRATASSVLIVGALIAGRITPSFQHTRPGRPFQSPDWLLIATCCGGAAAWLFCLLSSSRNPGLGSTLVSSHSPRELEKHDLRWALLPTALLTAFIGASLFGSGLAVIAGLWDVPFGGACAAAAVVLAGFLVAPTHKLRVATLILVIGAVTAWGVAPRSYPEDHERAYQPTHWALTGTYVGGVCGLLLCVWLRPRRGGLTPTGDQIDGAEGQQNERPPDQGVPVEAD